MTARLRLAGVRKAFAGVPVLRDVNLEIQPGEVVGLVGENGAGKSTLMHVVGGQLPADGGAMAVDGVPYAPATPQEARRAGVVVVQQELSLFPNLTIAENLQIHRFPCWGRWPLIDRRASHRAAAALMARVGLSRAPGTRVDRLSAGERQLVEIARALGADARLMVLDEPTTSLGVTERARLFHLIAELRRGGLSIVLVSHELDDVLRSSDRVAVLRDGVLVDSGEAAGFDVDRLVRSMVGRELRELYPQRPAAGSAPVPLLTVNDLAARAAGPGVTLSVGAGEIVGVFGLLGAGRSALARRLLGLEPAARGDVRLGGRRLRGGPAARIDAGLVLVTEDRRGDGLCLEASVGDNLTLPIVGRLARAVRGIDRDAERQAVTETVAAVRLHAADPRQAVGRLSGGNQQKVVLGKWLLTRPRALILDEPTRGIDVAARADLYRLLVGLTSVGTGLLVFSSDLEELIGLCDRLLVMRQGAITASLTRPGFDRAAILRAALPATVSA